MAQKYELADLSLITIIKSSLIEFGSWRRSIIEKLRRKAIVNTIARNDTLAVAVVVGSKSIMIVEQ